jgi:hypothetical protein
MEVASLLSWLVTIVHVLLALALGALCLVRMRRLGTGGALLVLGVALLDVLISLAYRGFSLFVTTLPPRTLDTGYLMLNIGSAIVSLLSAVMILVALILIGRAQAGTQLAPPPT